MAEPMTLNAIMNSHITHTADAARALADAQLSLDECILSLNLERELKLIGVKIWGDRWQVLNFVEHVRPTHQHGAHKRRRARLHRKCKVR